MQPAVLLMTPPESPDLRPPATLTLQLSSRIGTPAGHQKVAPKLAESDSTCVSKSPTATESPSKADGSPAGQSLTEYVNRATLMSPRNRRRTSWRPNAAESSESGSGTHTPRTVSGAAGSGSGSRSHTPRATPGAASSHTSVSTSSENSDHKQLTIISHDNDEARWFEDVYDNYPLVVVQVCTKWCN